LFVPRPAREAGRALGSRRQPCRPRPAARARPSRRGPRPATPSTFAPWSGRTSATRRSCGWSPRPSPSRAAASSSARRMGACARARVCTYFYEHACMRACRGVLHACLEPTLQPNPTTPLPPYLGWENPNQVPQRLRRGSSDGQRDAPPLFPRPGLQGKAFLCCVFVFGAGGLRAWTCFLTYLCGDAYRSVE